MKRYFNFLITKICSLDYNFYNLLVYLLDLLSI